MAKVLLVNPIIREEDSPQHIPYGISLLAAIAVKEGHQVQIFDANAWRKGLDVLEQIYLADDWDMIGIGGLTTTYGYVKDACRLAKKVNSETFVYKKSGIVNFGGSSRSSGNKSSIWLYSY